MKEIGVIFNTEMVQAYMEGRKNQTRRIKGLKLFNEDPDKWQISDVKHLELFHLNLIGGNVSVGFKSPYGLSGDIIWIKETYMEDDGDIYYKADFDKSDQEWFKGFWKPSIFMPKSVCRFKAKIVHVSLERLHEISKEDAINEGIIRNKLDLPFKPQSKFFNLWEKINGTRSLELNPWVWRIQFEKFN